MKKKKRIEFCIFKKKKFQWQISWILPLWIGVSIKKICFKKKRTWKKNCQLFLVKKKIFACYSSFYYSIFLCYFFKKTEGLFFEKKKLKKRKLQKKKIQVQRGQLKVIFLTNLVPVDDYKRLESKGKHKQKARLFYDGKRNEFKIF